jgi:uncharacterized protein YggU (UPF0235/DUF167 family)
MDAADRPWVVSADGLIVTVRLTPKAGRDSIDGIVHLSDGGTVLKARVSAAPSDGEANGALRRLLAQTLRIAPSNITLIGGTASRIKRMLVKGDVAAVVAALEQIREVAAR